MNDTLFMQRALELARQGEGFVEPNPMVGCVLVKDGNIVGEGFHAQFGGPHAEVEAIRDAVNRNGEKAANGATCYVTLEPCSHYGKTPPCTSAVLSAGIRRVVVAMRDPNPAVNGCGLEILRNAGLEVTENVLEKEARSLNAPYLMLLEQNRPWIIAKWAMTLDGRLASRTGSSHWISGEASRQIVHRLRSRMDAIMIGSQTARQDDPLLTVRLDNDSIVPRTPIRIVLDSKAELDMESRLVQTARKIPVLLVVSTDALPKRIKILQDAGCEILRLPSAYQEKTTALLKYLAQRKLTNLLVEGGSRLFGTLFDMKLIDEVHVFIAPKLIGGESARSVIDGIGLPEMKFTRRLELPEIQIVEQDIYVHGRIRP